MNTANKILLITSTVILTITTSCQPTDKKISVKKEVAGEKLSYPQSTTFDNTYLQSNFWRLSYDTAGPELAYKIVLPKTMKPTNLDPTPLNDLGLTLIGKYQVIEENIPYMEIEVAYEKASDEYPSIKNWMKVN